MKIGDTRTTSDGSTETLTDLKGNIQVWTLTHLSDEFKSAQATAAARQAKLNQIQSIQQQLVALDVASARSLRAILVAQHNNQTPNTEDISTLQAHEAQAVTLRAQLADININN